MTPSEQQVSWRLWPLWIAATAAGSALGAAALHAQAHIPFPFASVPVIGLVVVTLPAVLQWLILRHWLPRAGWWILAGAVGAGLSWVPLGWGLAVADTQGTSTFAKVAVPAAFLLTGAVQGAVEWLVLRRWASRAGWWVLARTIASFGAIFVFASMTRGADIRLFLGGLVSGALSGAVAGLALVLLLRNAKKHESSAPITSEKSTHYRSA